MKVKIANDSTSAVVNLALDTILKGKQALVFVNSKRSAEKMAEEHYVDRLSCEFHSQIIGHFMDRNILMYPRFSSDREDWVQQIVAAGNAVCIMPERSATVAGIDARPVENMDLEREVVLVAISGTGTPAELRQILRMASTYAW